MNMTQLQELKNLRLELDSLKEKVQALELLTIAKPNLIESMHPRKPGRPKGARNGSGQAASSD